MTINTGREIKTALLKGDESIYTIRSFTLNEGLEFLNETEVIAGYECKKAKIVINPNTLEVEAGGHQLKVTIPVGDPAGNSLSYWCISGVLVGDADDNPPT